jgi:hypothetical protein
MPSATTDFRRTMESSSDVRVIEKKPPVVAQAGIAASTPTLHGVFLPAHEDQSHLAIVREMRILALTVRFLRTTIIRVAEKRGKAGCGSSPKLG